MDLQEVSARAYRIPTDAPEADGTFAWDATTVVVATARAGGQHGVGYTYTHEAAARLINTHLARIVTGHDVMAIRGAWQAMVESVRNIGLPGLAANAISAVDGALWDLKAKLVGLPLVHLLGGARSKVPIYGSGGFTSYSPFALEGQLEAWAALGIDAVKMKIGTHPQDDTKRVADAREAVGPDVALFVDANGAYDRAQAVGLAQAFARQGVVWFEEPVSSDDLAGLRLIRQQIPPGMAIAAGEYGYTPWYFRRMLEAEAVDILQADATRCLGITGFLQVAALCEAFGTPLSSHTAPALHLHPCCAAPQLRHMEWFHDHARIEAMLFDGIVEPVAGSLQPDLTRNGLGLTFKETDAERWVL